MEKALRYQVATLPLRLTIALVAVALTLSDSRVDAYSGRYVCSPCGLPCDTKTFDKPGTCPDCGMALVSEDEAKKAVASVPSSKKVAILIFDGVEIIDFTGPYEVFGAANFDVYTVAQTKSPITTAMGMTVTPKYSFDDVPQPDVLVVPGGGVKAIRDNPTVLRWIREETAKIRHTMSVCNGAFILADAGLLDGLSATTTCGNIPQLKTGYPKIKVVSDQRYVDNGKIITTAGLSAGIDGALHVVELMMGKGYAQEVALSEEYDFSDRAGFVRASLADRCLPEIHLSDRVGRWETVSTEGGKDRWKKVMRGPADMAIGELNDLLAKALSSAGWVLKQSNKDRTSAWVFNDERGNPWSAAVSLQEEAEKMHQYRISVTIHRDGSSSLP